MAAERSDDSRGARGGGRQHVPSDADRVALLDEPPVGREKTSSIRRRPGCHRQSSLLRNVVSGERQAPDAAAAVMASGDSRCYRPDDGRAPPQTRLRGNFGAELGAPEPSTGER
jgi:hypothetical protein